MVYGADEYWLKTMDKDKAYYFTIETINENGMGPKYLVVKSE